MRAAAARLVRGHGRADPEHPRLVRRRGDHSALTDPADDHRLAAQRRLVPLLDGGEERVQIQVQDRRLRSHRPILPGAATRERDLWSDSLPRERVPKTTTGCVARMPCRRQAPDGAASSGPLPSGPSAAVAGTRRRQLRQQEQNVPVSPMSNGKKLDVWPGKPYPLGATFDGSGVNFALFSEAADRVELCLIDDGTAADRDPGRADRGRRFGLARLPAAHPAGPAVRLPGARPVRSEPGPPLQPGQAAARPVREGHRRHDRRRRVAVLLPVRRPERLQRPRLAGPHHALGGDEPVLRLGS